MSFLVNFLLFHDLERALARMILAFFFLLTVLLSIAFFIFVINFIRKQNIFVQLISTPLISIITSSVIIISVTISGFLSQLIGIFLAPDYIIGFILYDIWSYIYTWIIFITFAFIYFRAKKQGKLIFIVTIVLVLAVFSSSLYIMNLRYMEENAIGANNPYWKITDDKQFINTDMGFSYTLFPRNGTWSKVTGATPASENSYNASARIYKLKEEVGKYLVYDNCVLGYVPYDISGLQEIGTTENIGLIWKLYERSQPDNKNKYFKAVSANQDNLIELEFSYQTTMNPLNIFLPIQARHFFIQTVHSFKLIPPIHPLESYGGATCTTIPNKSP